LQANQCLCAMAGGSVARVTACVLLFCITVLPASDLRCQMGPGISITSDNNTAPIKIPMRNRQAPLPSQHLHHSGTQSHTDLAKLHVDICSATAGLAQMPPVLTAFHVRLPTFAQLRWHQLGLTTPQNRESFSASGRASGASSEVRLQIAFDCVLQLLEYICQVLIAYKVPKCKHISGLFCCDKAICLLGAIMLIRAACRCRPGAMQRACLAGCQRPSCADISSGGCLCCGPWQYHMGFRPRVLPAMAGCCPGCSLCHPQLVVTPDDGEPNSNLTSCKYSNAVSA
jgi:hypothetical protein